MVIADPCAEITYYAWELNREDYLQQNIHPKLRKILQEATTKNYSTVWLDEFEDDADIINFVEKTIEMQVPLSVAFPISPILEMSSPNQLIKLAFKINEEACIISHNLEKNFLGCYLPIHSSLFSNDARAKSKLNIITNKLIELLKKHNKVCLFIKLIDMENSSSYSFEKAINLAKFCNEISCLKATDHINGHNFLLLTGGLTKKYAMLVAKGSDCSIELMNGKTTINKPKAYNTKNRKKNFQFGDFYDMNNQIMISYDALMEYWKRNKALPSYTEVAKNISLDKLENHIRYAKVKRLNQIEARCLEIEQIRKDIISGLERGLQDRLSRSTDLELQALAKLF